MSSDPREPENYSISEMMDRLKERSNGDRSNGELVTRADGTQAIKVRSRKRRSHQPHRENEQRARRMRAVQLVAVVVVLGLLLVVAGGVVVYMNGSGYRNGVMAKAGAASGAKVDATQFRVTPIGANAMTLSFDWPDSVPLKKLNLQGVSAELRVTSFLGQPWTGEEVTAQKGELLVGVPSEGSEIASTGGSNFKFNRFRCSNLSMYFGDPRGPAMSILGSEVSLYPKGSDGRPELRLNRGTVKFRKNLPDFALDRALIGVTGRQLDIVSLRLRESGDGKGSVELVGQVESGGSGRATTLDVAAKDLPLEYLAGPELGRLLHGRIETRSTPNSNFLTFDPAKPDAQRVVISFQGGFGSSMQLAQLPFLAQLRTMFNDEGFQDLDLESGSSGVLRINGAETSLDDLRLESKGRLMIRGGISMSAGKALSGRLEVGLPAPLVAGKPRLDAAFGPKREDMRWLEVTVSGTVAAPVDDFDKKVFAQGAIRSSGEAPKEPAASEFEKLTQPR
ncbi:hypothetical protein [Luteolibacter sp. LG18]|uniref:hypothetical protein n=1 Tax=Luteolibacter sp. LG18 TaxID=2819286 RepID=UPI002B294287|nr:hypothetical protein llg_45080 [Luteolibacter sp. LG18]